MYNFDIDHIGIWGASAGANLALLTAFTPDDLYIGDNELKKYSSSVKFVIDNFGPTDLNDLLRTNANQYKLKIFRFFDEEKYNMRNKKIREITGFNIENEKEKTIQQCELFSPLHYINKNTVPTLILHGTADETVNVKQSEILRDKLLILKVPQKFYLYKDLTHGFKNADEKQIAEITNHTIQFVRKQME